MNDPHGHDPVLVKELLELLNPRAGETVLDCTAGRGGHAEAIARRIHHGRIMLYDLDEANVAYAADRVRAVSPDIDLKVRAGSFAEAPEELQGWGFRADVVLADLGFSSNQLENPARGFSFREDGPLDMRLDPRQRTTAAHIIARSSEKELADIIYHLGEEPLARRIAGKLAHARKERPIDTTGALAGLVREAYGPRARASRMDPATRTFMALRIAVNNELGALESLLGSIEGGARQVSEGSTGWLNRGARIGIISFHSLEDRMVKRGFASLVQQDLAERITKKPVMAGEEEVSANPRARSAKFRAVRIRQATRIEERHVGSVRAYHRG